MSRIKLFGNNRTRPRYLERAGGESRYYRDAGEEEDYARSPLKPITIVLAVLAICAGPFCQIGVQYLMLKLTWALCGITGNKRLTELVGNFAQAMGLLLAMVGVCCLMLLISLACFMKGAGYT